MHNLESIEELGWSGPWVVFCDRRLLTAPISDSALRLWLVLRAHASQDARTAYPGTPRLMEQMRCSERQVRELLAELEGAGLLRRELVPTRTGVRRVTHLTDDRAWCDQREGGGVGGSGTGVPGGPAQVCRGKNHPDEEGVRGFGGVMPEPATQTLPQTTNPTPLAAPETPKATTTPNPTQRQTKQEPPRPRTAMEAGVRGRATGKTHPGASCEADREAEAAERRGGDVYRAWCQAYDRALMNLTAAKAAPPPLLPPPPPLVPGTTGPVTRAQAAAASAHAEDRCEHGQQPWRCQPCAAASAAALAQIRRALQRGQPMPALGVSP